MANDTQIFEDAVVNDIKKNLDIWRRMANSLQGGVIALGVTSILSSLFITAFAGVLGNHDSTIIRIVAFVATLSLTLIGAFNLPAKASSVRNAWRHLNKAFYSFSARRIDIDALIKAYEEGESMLGSVDFSYDKARAKQE
ncbi:hypothetical protein [Foetidibacter luteolus]|uniref:hypothetical protein n=1 Tax=Foetidibacter luteolus TaxID=2608880 RepID=UPI00129A1ECD|nr:hypothetical protein [Foetidibacter luteolus]